MEGEVTQPRDNAAADDAKDAERDAGRGPAFFNKRLEKQHEHGRQPL
jgi:hypothetical protein